MSPDRARLLRLGLLAAFVVTVLVVGEESGLRRALTIARIRETMLHAGAYGVLLYTVAFVVGMVLHVPGLLFCAAGIAIWGRLEGGVIAWFGAWLAITASFVVVRTIGGQVLVDAKHPWLKRILAHLQDRPIRTVVLLRAVLMISPPVTYALALSPVRFRDVFIGSAIGLVPPMVAAAIGFHYLLRWLGV